MKKKAAEIGLRVVGVRKDIAKTVSQSAGETVANIRDGHSAVAETQKLAQQVIRENGISGADIAELGMTSVGVPKVIAQPMAQGGGAIVQGLRDGEGIGSVLKGGADAASSANRTSRAVSKVVRKVAPSAATLAKNIRNNDIR